MIRQEEQFLSGNACTMVIRDPTPSYTCMHDTRLVILNTQHIQCRRMQIVPLFLMHSRQQTSVAATITANVYAKVPKT